MLRECVLSPAGTHGHVVACGNDYASRCVMRMSACMDGGWIVHTRGEGDALGNIDDLTGVTDLLPVALAPPALRAVTRPRRRRASHPLRSGSRADGRRWMTTCSLSAAIAPLATQLCRRDALLTNI